MTWSNPGNQLAFPLRLFHGFGISPVPTATYVLFLTGPSVEGLLKRPQHPRMFRKYSIFGWHSSGDVECHRERIRPICELGLEIRTIQGSAVGWARGPFFFPFLNSSKRSGLLLSCCFKLLRFAKVSSAFLDNLGSLATGWSCCGLSY